jgi:hypothetical protein
MRRALASRTAKRDAMERVAAFHAHLEITEIVWTNVPDDSLSRRRAIPSNDRINTALLLESQ